MWWPLVLLGSLSLLEGRLVVQSGLATGYTPYSKEIVKVGRQRVQMSGGKPYCAWFGYEGKGQLVLAHRTWPCGTRVWVSVPRTGMGAWAVVIDRGPYGAMGHRGDGLYCRHHLGRGREWCVKRPMRIVDGEVRRPDPGRWRGIADLSTELRILLDHNGMEVVRLVTTRAEIYRAWRVFKSRIPTT